MARHMILEKIDNSITSLTFNKRTEYVLATVDKQKIFEIPMENFNPLKHLFEVRIGTTWFSEERYDIVDNTIVLKEDEDGVALGRKVAFIFTYLE